MQVSIANNKFWLLLLGGLIIQAAVSVENSSEKMGWTGPVFENVPMAVFIGGWVLVAYAIALVGGNGFNVGMDQRTLAAFGGSALVVGAVRMMKAAMKTGRQPNMLEAMGFPLGWALVAYAIFMQTRMQLRGLAWVAAGMVLFAMMFLLPLQTEKCIPHLGGDKLFSMAWILLALANGVTTIQA